MRVLVVDDHDVVQWGFGTLFSEEAWVDQCFSARSAEEAVELARTHRPHVALVDLMLASASGIDATRQIRDASPDTRVLLMSGVGSVAREAALAAGAYGFVPKDWPARDIAHATRIVGLGMTLFRPESDPAGGGLSERERQVLDMIAAGATNKEIAERLYLSPHTVKDHTSALYKKIGARNRTEAIRRAQRLGLLG